MGIIRLFSFIYCFLTVFALYSQSHNASAYEHYANPSIQREHIQFLTTGETNGRAAGSRGGFVAKEYIEQKFEEYGVERRGVLYYQPFKEKDITCYNVIGEISAVPHSDEYLIIGAHYDHLGEINGKVYPGADDNASGVAALLELARMFANMKKDGKHITKNILFVAFDAKEMSMAGSRNFMNITRIQPEKIACMINIDQIGSSLAPPGDNPNYLLVLGRDSLQPWAAKSIDLCNKAAHLNLDIDYTFYNSKNFYKLFYRLSDHNTFVQNGVPTLFFTSGITDLTYKEGDTMDKINYPVLTNRVKLIFHFVYGMVR